MVGPSECLAHYLHLHRRWLDFFLSRLLFLTLRTTILLWFARESPVLGTSNHVGTFILRIIYHCSLLFLVSKLWPNLTKYRHNIWKIIVHPEKERKNQVCPENSILQLDHNGIYWIEFSWHILIQKYTGYQNTHR